eukprot:scaffold446_cov336-Prasinococcus_capsulatus_cf.AAC.5
MQSGVALRVHRVHVHACPSRRRAAAQSVTEQQHAEQPPTACESGAHTGCEDAPHGVGAALLGRLAQAVGGACQARGAIAAAAAAAAAATAAAFQPREAAGPACNNNDNRTRAEDDDDGGGGCGGG